MRGLILSGGKGTRLRPITHTWAKQLVPVANKPVLFYGIEAMVGAGITRSASSSRRRRDEIREAAGDGSAFGTRSRTSSRPTAWPRPRGCSPRSISSATRLSSCTSATTCCATASSTCRHVPGRRARRADPAHPVPDPENYGVAELTDGRVARLAEKPAEPKTDLALVGVYMFTPTIFDAARAIEPSARGELEITDAIQYLVDHGKRVEPHLVDGWWKDTGRVQDMLEANRLVLDDLEQTRRRAGGLAGRGPRRIEAGARLERSVVRGPAIICRCASPDGLLHRALQRDRRRGHGRALRARVLDRPLRLVDLRPRRTASRRA